MLWFFPSNNWVLSQINNKGFVVSFGLQLFFFGLASRNNINLKLFKWLFFYCKGQLYNLTRTVETEFGPIHPLLSFSFLKVFLFGAFVVDMLKKRQKIDIFFFTRHIWRVNIQSQQNDNNMCTAVYCMAKRSCPRKSGQGFLIIQ